MTRTVQCLRCLPIAGKPVGDPWFHGCWQRTRLPELQWRESSWKDLGDTQLCGFRVRAAAVPVLRRPHSLRDGQAPVPSKCLGSIQILGDVAELSVTCSQRACCCLRAHCTQRKPLTLSEACLWGAREGPAVETGLSSVRRGLSPVALLLDGDALRSAAEA